VKITEIETIPLRLPFAQPFKISQGADRESLKTLIVRVRTDEGIVGIGETQAWRRQGSAELLWNLVRTIKDHFEPLIAGRSPFDVGGILHKRCTTRSTRRRPSPTRSTTSPGRRSGCPCTSSSVASAATGCGSAASSR